MSCVASCCISLEKERRALRASATSIIWPPYSIIYPLETATMRKAAELWADARSRGQPTARDESLDADAILAAQAIAVDGTIITSNRKHLAQFVAVKEWTELTPGSS
jgi:predicted nucleic acid-binding protein